MVELKRERMVAHSRIPSTQTGLGAGCLVLFGLPFLTIGLGVIALGSGHLDIPLRTSRNSQPWILEVFGLVFALAGLAVIGGGIAGLLRTRAARIRKEEHPLEPWYWDYDWDSRGAESGGLGEAIQAFITFLALALFLSMFNWMVFFAGEAPLPPKLIVGLFDLIALGVLASAFYSLFQYFKYGKSRFHFARFPFRPGSSVEGGLEASRKLGAAPTVTLALRYIEDVVEVTNSGRSRSQQNVLYCLYEVKQELSGGQFNAGSELGIPINMRLPDGDVSNELLNSPRRYWELEVKAETPGIDYVARFLLPVYKA